MAPNCYRRTEYCYVVRSLLCKDRNPESTEKCPKCSTEIDSHFKLMVHIETFHPNDVKHKPYLKQVPQHEETASSTVNDFEITDENVVTINEEFPVFQTSDSLPDSSTLDELKDNPFFKVIMFLVQQNI